MKLIVVILSVLASSVIAQSGPKVTDKVNLSKKD